MKKWLVVMLLMPLMALADVWMDPDTGIEWTYVASGGSASVGGGSWNRPAVPMATAGEITIPPRLGDCPVTSVGAYAFYDCSGLTSVTIPQGVTNIEDHAFWGCSGLTSMTIPEGVTIIGEYAFLGCSGLTSVTMPKSVISSGKCAFSNCNGLTSVTVPDRLKVSDVFLNCREALTNVTILVAEGKLCDYAFNGCTGLTSVTIPEGVTNIDEWAFLNCSGLKSVTMPEGVTSIGSSAFYGCTGLTSVTISDGVTSIGVNAFYGCSGLTSVTIPASATNIGGFAFNGCTSLTSATIPDRINASSVFLGCRDTLTNITVLAVDGKIREHSYSDFSGLVSVKIPEGVTDIGGFAFYNCHKLKSVTIPESVTSIGSAAFFGCSALTDVKIPDGVTSIGANAFYGCSALVSVAIPAGATHVEEGAFSCCRGIRSVTISGGFKVYEVFSGCCEFLTNVTILAVGGTIREAALYECSGLTSVTIPEGMTNIGELAFAYCSGLTSVTMPEGVTSIGEYAFSGCGALASVAIPESVTNVGDGAFSYCSGLKSLIMPDGVNNIGKKMFYKCSGLTSVTIPDGVTSIGEEAFSDCTGLTAVTIPDGVTSMGDYAFRGCSALASVAIPPSMTSIGDRAFYECPALKTIRVRSEADIDAVKKMLTWSRFDVTGVTFVTDDEPIDMPVIDPPDGSAFEAESCQVSITCATAGAAIYYRIGAAPKTSSRFAYAGPFAITETSRIYSYAVKDGRSSPTNVVKITKGHVLTFAEAASAERVGDFTFGGDADWFVADDAGAKVGDASVRSGAIGDGQATWFEAEVEGEGTLSFWWRASCEEDELQEFDHLAFSVDGEEISRIDGVADWVLTTVNLGAGRHVLRWCYEKDESEADGEDCGWVDGIVWMPAAAVPTLTALAEIFGEKSDVVKGIETEAQLSAFNGFLRDCKVAAAADMSAAQKQYAYRSFRLSEITTAPRLLEEEPVLKISDVAFGDGNFSLTISLTAGDEAIALAKDHLADKIRVGTSPDSIADMPEILASPSSDGISLTFTISKPQGNRGFVQIRID